MKVLEPRGAWSMRSSIAIANVTLAGLGARYPAGRDSAPGGVPHPTDRKAVGAPLQRDAEVKAFGAFAELARSVDVRQDEDIVLTPRKNLGAKAGVFVSIDENWRRRTGRGR